MPARSGRPLDVFDWGHGGALDGRDTGQRQKGSQYSKSTLSLATAASVKKVLNMMRLAQSWLQWGGFYATRSTSLCFRLLLGDHFQSISRKRFLQSRGTKAEFMGYNKVNWEGKFLSPPGQRFGRLQVGWGEVFAHQRVTVCQII